MQGYIRFRHTRLRQEGSLWVWRKKEERFGFAGPCGHEKNLWESRPENVMKGVWLPGQSGWIWSYDRQTSRWPCPHCKQRNPCLDYRACLRPPSQGVTESISVLSTLSLVSSWNSVLHLKGSGAAREEMEVLHFDIARELERVLLQWPAPPPLQERALGIARNLGARPTFTSENPFWAPWLATSVQLPWPGCSFTVE